MFAYTVVSLLKHLEPALAASFSGLTVCLWTRYHLFGLRGER